MPLAGSETQFRLDLSDERLWDGSIVVPLPRKTFSMLRYFVLHPNHLLTKEAILESIWPNTCVTEGSIKDYVKAIRRVLGDDPRQPRFVQTVRGRGYRYLGGIKVTGRHFGQSPQASRREASPAIAVLPFDNMSSDPELTYLADGLTEDLITALSKVRKLSVVARHSTALYKGKAVQVQEVAESLGVGYVLEGGIQTSGGSLRCTVQLVDALRGHHLWAERYDRPMKEVFALQDEIVRLVLVELQVRLTSGDGARLASRGTRNLEAWLLNDQATAEIDDVTQEGAVRARELYEAAREVDPAWARPLSGLAVCHYCHARYGWSASREDSIALGIGLAEQAIAMDPEEPAGYMALRGFNLLLGKPDKALSLVQKAVSLTPNDFAVVGLLAATLAYMDEAPRALQAFDRARRLAPVFPRWFHRMYGLALHLADRTDQAIAVFEDLARQEPQWSLGLAQLAASYASVGRIDAAKATTKEILDSDPTYTVSRELALVGFPSEHRMEWLRALLVRAGLPE